MLTRSDPRPAADELTQAACCSGAFWQVRIDQRQLCMCLLVPAGRCACIAPLAGVTK